MIKKQKEEDKEIVIMEIKRGVMEFCVLGTSPLIIHAVSEKNRKELLFPGEKKTAASKAVNLKHNPMEEYVGSLYLNDDEKSPTFLSIPSVSFKKSMCQAALDIPGAAKAQIGRLTYVEDTWIPVYGIPKLHMTVVRMSDIGHTPDIRTRPILEEWACTIKVGYTKPIMKEQAVVNLLAAAGITQGIGDGRQQKGTYSYGQFAIVPKDDKNFQRIIKSGSRANQIKAVENPEFYDEETAKLMAWFDSEVKRRGFTLVKR